MSMRLPQLFLVTLAILSIISNAIAWKAPPGVSLVGRFAVDVDNDSYQAMWPGSGIRFRVKADPMAHQKSITVTMSYSNCDASSATCKYFIGAFVDGQQIGKYEINNQSNQLTVTIPINNGVAIGSEEIREVRLIKLTESSNGDAKGVMQLGQLHVTGGKILPKDGSMEHKKKMLVIGDSITAAYGVDGNMPCTYTASTEDVTHGYAFLVATTIDAEVDTIAWSGKGVVRNYGDVNQMSTEPMTAYYNRTLAIYPATDKKTNYWHPARFMPDIVLITLGTNDYSTEPSPSEEMFVNGYVDFIGQVRKDYPNVPILSICAPLNTGNQCAYTEQAATKANVNYFAVPTNTVTGYGCDYHPNKESQQLIAQAVTPVVQKILQL